MKKGREKGRAIVVAARFNQFHSLSLLTFCNLIVCFVAWARHTHILLYTHTTLIHTHTHLNIDMTALNFISLFGHVPWPSHGLNAIFSGFIHSWLQK